MPATFRSHLNSMGYNGFITYPSFNHLALEACSQDRIEVLSDTIDSLNPFEDKRDYFATSVLSESVNLQFDTEGRISLTKKLLDHARIKNNVLFVGLGKTFQIWEPNQFEKFKILARKILIKIDQILDGITNRKGAIMSINIGGGELKELKPRILVLGVGGAGGNAINAMIDSGMQGVEFVAVNIDAQDLKMSKAHAKIQIGMNLTKGLGAGAKHNIGQAQVDESIGEIVNYMQGSNMIFIVMGMGGGTVIGASHVIAKAAKELNILTVGVTYIAIFL